MKRQVLILLVAVVVLLAGGIVQAQLAPAVAQGTGGGQANAATLNGGHYRLVSLDAGGNILAAGGGYMLWGPAVPEQGAGCCCTYMPCVLRSFP